MLSLGYTPTRLWCPRCCGHSTWDSSCPKTTGHGANSAVSPKQALLSSAPLLGPVLSVGGPQPASFKKPLLWADSHWLADTCRAARSGWEQITGTPWVSDIDGTSFNLASCSQGVSQDALLTFKPKPSSGLAGACLKPGPEKATGQCSRIHQTGAESHS